MARSVRLRSWQKAALELFLTSQRQDFLAVATPGAGKTTFALTAARHHLADNPDARVVVVVPTQHLKSQWASAALRFDLHLEPEWAASNGRLPSDMHGIVTTYQQVAVNATTLAAITDQAFVVFDELHHAADDQTWGDAVRKAFTPASRRLALSGTPFRSDTHSIPFINYTEDTAVPDFEYGYGEALSDRGVVRPVYFPRIDGEMEWTAPDGTYNSASFGDELDAVRAGQRLRTALSLDGEWLPVVLRQAHKKLEMIRSTHPDAGGLIIAMDQDHARGIAGILKARFGIRAAVATSDDPMASVRIAHFATGSEPWIIAVRMISEGVDIPRLRVGVFATNTTTDLFFRQAIGRLVRYTRGVGRQPAYMFIPDDSRLRTKASELATQRRHSLRKKQDPSEADLLERALDDMQTAPGDRVDSMFAAISAVAVGSPVEYEVDADDSDDDHNDNDSGGDDDASLTIDLAPAPPLAAVGGADATNGLTRAQHKGELRDANSAAVRELVHLTGMTHAAVNGELNRLANIKRITEATVLQLKRRLDHAERWLDKLTRSA